MIRNEKEMPRHQPLIQLIYWIVWVFVVVMIVISKRNTKRLDLIYIQIVALLIRNILSILDFEEKRFDEKRNISVFIVLQL